MTLPTDPKPPQINWRLLAGYFMIAFGAPMFFLACVLLRTAYSRRYGPPMAHFSLHDPITIVVLCAAIGGVALVIAGRIVLGRQVDGTIDPDQRRLKP